MKHLLPLLLLALCGCETTFADSRELPEPPALPAVQIECPPSGSFSLDKMNVFY